MGTVSGGSGENRAVILTKKDRKQKLYEAGELVEGAQIKRILRGKVVLNFNGKDEVLDMSEAAKYGKGGASGPVSAAPSYRRPQVEQARPAVPTAAREPVQRQQAVRIRVVRPIRRIVPQQPQDRESGGPAGPATK